MRSLVSVILLWSIFCNIVALVLLYPGEINSISSISFLGYAFLIGGTIAQIILLIIRIVYVGDQ